MAFLVSERREEFFRQTSVPSQNELAGLTPAEQAEFIARQIAKHVLQFRSIDAQDRMDFLSELDHVIKTSSIGLLTSFRRHAMGESAPSSGINTMREVFFPNIRRYIEARADSVSDPGVRRYIRKKMAEAARSHYQIYFIESEFSLFIKNEIIVPLENELRKLIPENRSNAEIVAGMISRYPKVTAYLGQ